MKDYYALLAIAPDASADDIKRAFRREIARYHPDKVHHLGAEFQALASERAAELTEAYRVLMDAGLRAAYDGERLGGGVPPPVAPAPVDDAQEPAPSRPPDPEPPPPSGPVRAATPRPTEGQATRDAFVRRVSMSRFREAVERAVDGVASMPARGFDAGYLVRGRRSLFAKPVSERVLGAYLGEVTGDSLTRVGHDALAGRAGAVVVSAFALGDRLAPSGELSAAIVGLRRRVPAGVTLQVVPLDVRDWTAMTPKDASATVRAVIAQLTAPV